MNARKKLIILLGMYVLLFRIKLWSHITFHIECIRQKIYAINNTKRGILCVQNPAPAYLQFTEPWNLPQHEYLKLSSTGF
jgi:hypothetical protein